MFSQKKPVTLYLIGFAGVGKYTIAQEFVKVGYKLVDNHLINNPIFSLLDLDSANGKSLQGSKIPDNAWDAIGKIRGAVLDFVACDSESDFVMTNELLHDPDEHTIYNKVKEIAERRGSLFVPAKLSLDRHEHAKRIKSSGRREKHKSTHLDVAKLERGLIMVEHPHLLEFDITGKASTEVMREILEHVYSLG